MKNRILLWNDDDGNSWIKLNFKEEWFNIRNEWGKRALLRAFLNLRAFFNCMRSSHRSFYWHSKSASSLKHIKNTQRTLLDTHLYLFTVCQSNWKKTDSKEPKMDPLDEWLNNSTQSTFQITEPAFPLDNGQHWNTSTNLTVNTSKCSTTTLDKLF